MLTFPQPFPQVIDIHSHFDHGSPFDAGSAEPELHKRDLDFLQTEYARYGITHAGMSTFASVLFHPECVVEENAWLADLTERTDWMRQWVVIDPRQPETFQQAKALLDRPRSLGIKIHPEYHAYDIEEYGDKLFAFADALGATVLMHPQKIEKMPDFADKYPNMRLIIAHLGSAAHVDAIARAKHGNIYTDTSGSKSFFNHVLEYAVERVGSERILFGTDTYSCAFQLGRVALSPISREAQENIFFRNALRLFPNTFA